MSPGESLLADITDMRCLIICMAALERVNGSFEDNSTLEGIVADLIIPAVKRNELEMREKGLLCLGLCCLIAKVSGKSRIHGMFRLEPVLIGSPFRIWPLTRSNYSLVKSKIRQRISSRRFCK